MKPRGTAVQGLVSPSGKIAVDARLLEQIFDQTPDIAFFIKDGMGRYAVVNHSLVGRNGLRDKSQLLGKRPCDVCPGELGRFPTEQDAEVIRTGRPIIDRLEMHWYLPHRACWCLTTKLPMRDDSGAVCGLIGISQDVRVPMSLEQIPAGVEKAMRFLGEQYSGTVSASSLAKASGLPSARFARLIRRIYGITPTQLIAKTRIDAASLMLREGKLGMGEVAVACGFYDHSAFTKAFRSMMGITPTRYRDSCAGQESKR